MKQIIIFIVFVLIIIVYSSDPKFSSETSWEIISNDESCMLNATSKGVSIDITAMPSADLYAITVARPSKLNDLIHASIKWPAQNEFDNDYREEEIFAGFFSSKPVRMRLKMAHGGGGDGALLSSDKNDVYNLASSLRNFNNVELFKGYTTSVGSEVTRLGRWIANTKADKNKLISFDRCIRNL